MARKLIDVEPGALLEEEAVTTLRMLALDAIDQARSGHPGIALGLAPVAWVVATRVLRHDPRDPSWVARDRLVLSAGHGSALLYALLHLLGYDLAIDDLARFRQLGSRTPGHPEVGRTPGVEMTTGPLGQGLATAVGIALGGRRLAALTDQAVAPITYVLASDGDLLEGVSHEAAALAGQLGLGNLIVGWDANGITIDGILAASSRTDERARFASCGWQVLEVTDTEDLDEVEAVWLEARRNQAQPTLVVCPSVIGRGVPGLEGTSAVHGAPLGPDALQATKAHYGWPCSPRFLVPERVREHVRTLIAAREAEADAWRALHGELALPLWPGVPEGWELPVADRGAARATRRSSRDVLERVAALPGVVGGSADLAESTGTNISAPLLDRDHPEGSVLRFGVREHAMAAVANGLALVGFRPWVSTFLVFSDYLRPALRLSALMGLPVIYLLSHDSVEVGEDGPTHQPIEHLESLRAVPNLAVLRPADAAETVEAWRTALAREDGPTAIILTRQPAVQLPETSPPGWLASVGARVLVDPRVLEVVLVASGSELGLAMDAAELLAGRGVGARVVSVPWRERCGARGRALLGGPEVPKVVIEASRAPGWHALLGARDRVLGLEGFGVSGPGREVMASFGLTAEAIARVAEEVLEVPLGASRELLVATEAAACATQHLVGAGDKDAADAACVAAMRAVLATSALDALVVSGEGEKDGAPMLAPGERLGAGGCRLELAIDPLEGTTLAARGLPGAVSVIAAARHLRALPGYYAEKLVVPPCARGAVDLDRPLVENVAAVARALGRPLGATPVAVLAKPRHQEAIAALRREGIPVVEIPDGDVVAALLVLAGLGRAALAWGIGGVPEGLITAVAAEALGGELLLRLAPQREEERSLVRDAVSDFADRVYLGPDLVRGTPTVVATAVTDAGVLAAPAATRDGLSLESMLVGKGSWRIVRRTVAGERGR